jgi:hypoxanthine phosphoribosyltransferase
MDAAEVQPAVGEVFLDAGAIARRVEELGAQISRDYAGQEILLVGLLKGSIFFVSDLARAVTLPLEIDFLSLSSYRKEHMQTGAKAIRFLKDLDQPIKDKNVIVVQDMIDSGLTLHFIYRSLGLRRPRSLEACILFDRPQLRLVDLDVKYTGFDVSDDFFVGYGLPPVVPQSAVRGLSQHRRPRRGAVLNAGMPAGQGRMHWTYLKNTSKARSRDSGSSWAPVVSSRQSFIWWLMRWVPTRSRADLTAAS